VFPRLDGSISIADGLARAWRGYSYFVRLNQVDCRACWAEYATLQFHLIDNPGITREWANAYFWLNEPIPETPTAFTVDCSFDRDEQTQWQIWVTAPKAGLLTEHHFKPWTQSDPLAGPYGKASCQGGEMWAKAKTFAEQVLPIVATTEFHSACRKAHHQ
jgi:hypothetical protein